MRNQPNHEQNIKLELTSVALGSAFDQFQQMSEDPHSYFRPNITEESIPSSNNLIVLFRHLATLYIENPDSFANEVEEYGFNIGIDAVIELINFMSNVRMDEQQIIYVVLIYWLTTQNWMFIEFSVLNDDLRKHIEVLISNWSTRLGKEIETAALNSSGNTTINFVNVFVPKDIQATFQNLLKQGRNITNPVELSILIGNILTRVNSRDIDYILDFLENLSSLKDHTSIKSIWDTSVDCLHILATKTSRLTLEQQQKVDVLRSKRSTQSIETITPSHNNLTLYVTEKHDPRLVMHGLLSAEVSIPQVIEKLFTLLDQGLPLRIRNRNLKSLLAKALDLKKLPDSKESQYLLPSLTYVIAQIHISSGEVHLEVDEQIQSMLDELFSEV